MEESVSNDMEHLETSKDGDAKIGHKTADTSFFGYKTHIAMTEERIITAATVTSGEKTDGKELPALIQKSREAGMEIETVIGDKAYSSKENIDAAKNGDYELISRLNSIVTQGNRTKPDEFEFNKDAGMYQCKAGIWQYERQKTAGNQRVKIQESYIFSILRSVKDVRIGRVVIKKVRSQNNIRKPLSVTGIVNRHNFRKRNILKARQKSDIK